MQDGKRAAVCNSVLPRMRAVTSHDETANELKPAVDRARQRSVLLGRKDVCLFVRGGRAGCKVSAGLVMADGMDKHLQQYSIYSGGRDQQARGAAGMATGTDPGSGGLAVAAAPGVRRKRCATTAARRRDAADHRRQREAAPSGALSGVDAALGRARGQSSETRLVGAPPRVMLEARGRSGSGAATDRRRGRMVSFTTMNDWPDKFMKISNTFSFRYGS